MKKLQDLFSAERRWPAWRFYLSSRATLTRSFEDGIRPRQVVHQLCASVLTAQSADLTEGKSDLGKTFVKNFAPTARQKRRVRLSIIKRLWVTPVPLIRQAQLMIDQNVNRHVNQASVSQ